MIRIPVESKIVKSVGYDLKTSTLEVELAGKEHIRQYPGCPQHVFIELIQAPSIGKYYLKQVKGQLKQIKVGAEQEELWMISRQDQVGSSNPEGLELSLG
jgi:hypothetical protein